MISDVLFETLDDIERIQKDEPHVYDCYKDSIEKVKKEMERLRIFFDAPPGTYHCPESVSDEDVLVIMNRRKEIVQQEEE